MTPLNADILQRNLVNGLFQIGPSASACIVDPTQPIQLLGEGKFGKVVAAANPITGSPWAVKISKPNLLPNEEASLKKEYQVLSGPLRGAPHTVQVRGICRSADQKTQFAMQRLKGIDLFSFLQAQPSFFTAEKLRKIARQVLEALDYYHSRELVHSDMKIENCFYNPLTEELTIYDFGLCFSPSEKDENEGGTVGYLAPEKLLKDSPSYGTDIWALGVMLFTLYTGSKMFFDEKIDQNKEPFTADDLLSLFQIQFGLPFREYVGRWSLEERDRSFPKRAKEQYSQCEIWAEADTVILPWEKVIHPWYLSPWRIRLEHAARNKKDAEAADLWIIPFLEQLFVPDSRKRITARAALEMIPPPKAEFDPFLLPPPAKIYQA